MSYYRRTNSDIVLLKSLLKFTNVLFWVNQVTITILK